MGNIVAIVGRPNVGKSTLFNRLTESKSAIVSEISGVTRDRHYGRSEWNGREFSIIDTGGYVASSTDIFEEEIRKQVKVAIEEADSIIFLVDVENGVTDLDQEVARILRKTKKPVFLTVNKVDNNERLYEVSDFYRLGLGDLFPVSSINGSGTGDLLDAIVSTFTKDDEKPGDALPRIAVIGRPNVGKSTLINTLLGEERHIVTPIPGTTRDTIFTRYDKYNYHFELIDTAGLRKKGKVTENVEFYSVLRSIRAIESSDVCLLMVDAERGVEAQDVNILQLILNNRKGVVVAVNKWDLVEKDSNTVNRFSLNIKEKIAPFQDVPILFISAIHKKRVFDILEALMTVYNNRIRRITTSILNTTMLEIINQQPPPAYKGKQIKIKYVTQLPTHAPSFAFYCNLPQYIKDPYKRFLENQLRKHFTFSGVPLQIFLRKK